MATLAALTAETHRDLKISPNSGVIYAKSAHMIPLRITEAAQAIVHFPVLISRTVRGDMGLSMLTSFTPGQNLSVVDDEWDASFQPAAMKTYPVFLMRAEDGSPDPVVGIDEDSAALNSAEGTALFDKKGKPSLGQKQLKAQLLEDSKNSVHTFEFFKIAAGYDLIRPVDIILNFADGEISRITGLSVIHEDNLQNLDPEKLGELRDLGYLAPIYALLFSVLQLNALIRRHNKHNVSRQIKNINLEVSKDRP